VAQLVSVVIFKLVSDRLQHGGLGIARSLGRLGVPIYTVYRDVGTAAAASRYVTGRFHLRAGRLEPQQILGTLRQISDRVGDTPVLLPIDDLAAGFVDRFADELRLGFRFPAQIAGLATALSNKRQLDEMCRMSGTPAPELRVPSSEADFDRMAAELGFPVVIKSMDPALLRSRPRASSVAIAHDLEEARCLYRRMEVPESPNLMLQEYIPGGSTSVWMFNGYFDGEAVCRFGITAQKLRQAPPDTGATTLGICRPNAAVRSHAVGFLQSIGYRGIVDMGFRYDARDGTYRLLDVNPRIGSSFRLFVDQGGGDVVRSMYHDLTAQPIPTAPVRDGRRWLVENQDLATGVKLLVDGRLGPLDWIRSLRGVEELAWWARDDLRPVALMLLATARDSAAALIRRLVARFR
jgi:predicted ATP-grasp superfamily ATP-dependent carboligase